MKFPFLLFLSLLFFSPVPAQEISLGQNIFDLQDEHTHGSTIVELPNGDLLAAWFQGSGERWADDVRIMGARLHKDAQQWTSPFVMADVPDFPDINPVLFLDPRQKLWLVWYTVIANQWETSLLKYRISDTYQQADGPPQWQWQDVLHVKPGDPSERGIQAGDKFVRSVETQYEDYTRHLIEQGATVEQLDQWMRFKTDILAKARGEDMLRPGRVFHPDGTQTNQTMGCPYFRRMGWQTKNKPVFIGDRLLLPLYSDGLEMSMFAITDDYGAHWQFSTPLAGVANIQASVAQKKDGTLVAYMRDNGPPPQRHPMSFSVDRGLTWSPVRDSDLPNPGSGSDVVTLPNGHWAIAYNDTEDGRHSLAVSISADEGKSWAYTRHLELDHREQPNTGAYPAIIDGRDGRLHLTYSFTTGSGDQRMETIRYATFEESWISFRSIRK